MKDSKDVKQKNIRDLLEKEATEKFNVILKDSMLPSSDFLIKEFERTRLVIENNTTGITSILKANQEQFKQLNSFAASIPTPMISMPNLYLKHFEAIRKIQEQVLVPSSIITQALQPLFESAKVFESIALAQSNITKNLQGLVINLPLDGYLKTLSASTSFELTLSKFSSVKTHSNEYLLDGMTTETTRHEEVGIRVTTNFEMRLSRMEMKIDKSSEKVDYLIDSADRKDALLEELVQFIKSNGNPLVRIESISFNKTSTEILLDNKNIKLRGNTDQSDICRVVLKSKTSMKKVWEMEDIVEAIGEKKDNKNWHRAIYDAVNEINIKILIETNGSVPDFFIKTMKTVTVNPKYIS